MCPASHGRKVKGFERAGAPTVPRSGLEDGAKICIGLAMSMVCLWSLVRRPMSVFAIYFLALTFQGFFQGALHRCIVSLCRPGSPYTPLEDKENVEAGKMPLSKLDTITSVETGCPEVETNKLRRVRFSVLSKCYR